MQRKSHVKSDIAVCRLWPSVHNLHPFEVHPVVRATFSCIVSQNSKVLWVPAADSTAKHKGQRVSAQDACFVGTGAGQPRQHKAEIVNVARRAGLLLVDALVDIFQVRCCNRV